jgi:hypothetical protein
MMGGCAPDEDPEPDCAPGTHVTVTLEVVVVVPEVVPVDDEVSVTAKENPPPAAGVQLTDVPSSVIVPSHEKVAVPPSSPVLRVHESPSAAGSVMVVEPDCPSTVVLHVYVCPQYEQPPPAPAPLLPPGGVPDGWYGLLGCSCPPDGSYGVVGTS